MQKIPNGKYTKEFREEAVKLVTAKGHSIDEAVKSVDQRASLTSFSTRERTLFPSATAIFSFRNTVR